MFLNFIFVVNKKFRILDKKKETLYILNRLFNYNYKNYESKQYNKNNILLI